MLNLLNEIGTIQQCKTLGEIRDLAQRRRSWRDLPQVEQRVVRGHFDVAVTRLRVREARK